MVQIASQLAITCKDQDLTEAWYCKHFGFRRARIAVLPDGKKIVFLKMADCAFYLELFQADQENPIAEAQNDGYTFPGFRHFAFKVSDVDQKLAEIEQAEITLGPLNFDDYIPGWRTAWIRDPDGRIIEISQGFQDE